MISLLDPTPRERLALALEHLEASRQDPGRIGLAYVEVCHALRELGPEAIDADADLHPFGERLLVGKDASA